MTASLLAFAEAQVTPFEPPLVSAYLLGGECSFNPGVDHPPSGRGDGVRDNDITEGACSRDGVADVPGRS